MDLEHLFRLQSLQNLRDLYAFFEAEWPSILERLSRTDATVASAR